MIWPIHALSLARSFKFLAHSGVTECAGGWIRRGGVHFHETQSINGPVSLGVCASSCLPMPTSGVAESTLRTSTVWRKTARETCRHRSGRWGAEGCIEEQCQFPTAAEPATMPPPPSCCGNTTYCGSDKAVALAGVGLGGGGEVGVMHTLARSHNLRNFSSFSSWYKASSSLCLQPGL